MPTFHTLNINAVQPITPSATLLGFEVPDGLKASYTFTPGQYLSLEAEIHGEAIRRSYSICSGQHEDTLQVAVKHQEDGQFSTFARSLKVGDQLRVMEPSGRFTTTLGGSHRYLMIAAGSGITPILSMVRSVMYAEPDSHITLLYGNRDSQELMFLDELEYLKNQYIERFQLMHFLSQEDVDIPLFNGRIDTEKLEILCTTNIIKLHQYDSIFLCGPFSMVESLRTWLTEKGVDRKRIKKELFASEDRPQKKKSISVGIAEHATVQVIIDGRIRKFTLAPDEMLLDAAKRQKIDLPHSCSTGMCATCRCHLRDGEAEMRQNYSLEEWESEKGFMLACQVRPLSPVITLDFDKQ